MTRIGHQDRRATVSAGAGLLMVAHLLAGCTVLKVDEDRAIRARRTGALDPVAYVERVWSSRAVPTLTSRAVPLSTLLPAVAVNLDSAGRSYGRRAGEDSPWTFIVIGIGQVVSVDSLSPRGDVMVMLAGDRAGGVARFQLGPVVEGSAIRDALPFVAFDDFSDQLAFADVGRALTSRALAGVRPVVKLLHPGQTVRFTGVVNMRDPGEPLVITPLSLASDRAG